MTREGVNNCGCGYAGHAYIGFHLSDSIIPEIYS